MVNRISLSVLVVVFAISALAFKPLDDWIRFVPPEGTFAVLMPNQPEHSTKTSENPAGKIVTEIWRSSYQDGAYLVGATDYPVDVDPKKELDLDRDNFLKAVNAKLTSESDIKVGGYPGREFAGSGDNDDWASRVLVDGKRRVYQVAVRTPKSGDHSLATKCVNSFEILKSVSKYENSN